MVLISDDTDLSQLSKEKLLSIKEDYLETKRKLRREMDHIDTEIIGIKEELRKRKDPQ